MAGASVFKSVDVEVHLDEFSTDALFKEVCWRLRHEVGGGIDVERIFLSLRTGDPSWQQGARELVLRLVGRTI